MNKLICIDAGHGGSDPGACSSAAKEKNITLDISLKVEKLLLKQGFRVFMTRNKDIFDTPLTKARKANIAQANLFISIHCNSSNNVQANGTETLAYDLHGNSYKLAKAVQKQLISATKLRDRGVKQRKELAVLNSTAMPAILVEMAFISNSKERYLLLSDSFQLVIAQAICKGICEFYGIEYKGGTNMAGNKKDCPEWKKQGEKALRELGLTTSRHNPVEIVDYGSLGVILKNLTNR